MGRIKLFIADDHQLIREGIVRIFEDVGDMEIIGTASDGKEALENILLLTPDVVLLDISMPEYFGDEVIRKVREKSLQIKFLVITVYDSDFYIYKCFAAGGNGFISKGARKEKILEAIRSVYAGKRYCENLADEEIDSILQKYRNKEDFNLDYSEIAITIREKQVLIKMLQGEQTLKIAKMLMISDRTVERHKANLYNKFRVKSLNELIKLLDKDEKLKKLLLQ